MDPEVIEDLETAAPAASPAPTPAPPPDRGDVVTPPAPPPEPDEGDLDDPDAAPAPAAAKPKQGSSHVPIGRFNEVNEEKKALADRLALAEAENLRLKSETAPAASPAPTPAPPPAFDEDAQEKAYAEALMEGDTDKALKIRKDINAYIRAEAEAVADAKVDRKLAAKQTGDDLQAASEQAVKDFPFLDTEEGADALEAIVALRDSKIAAGKPAGQALREAVANLAPRFAPAATADDKDKDVKDTRPANAAARGAAASTAQPPAVQAGMGNRATAAKVNVSELTEEQFDALSAAEKKKLRGD